MASTVPEELVVHPAIEGIPRNGDFIVKVRAHGQQWQDIPVYVVKVAQGIDTKEPSHAAAAPLTGLRPADSSLAAFDFSGSVDVSITCNRGTIQSAKIRPLSYAITPSIAGNTITFSLSQPRNLSVEINGDIFRNLQLFAQPLETSRPNPNDPNVLYFGPGVHNIGTLAVPGGKTVYLAGGSLLIGSLLISHADNVRILGRGILSQAGLPPMNYSPPPTHETTSPSQRPSQTTRHDAILIEYSKHVEIDGIIEIPSAYTVLVGQSDDVTIRNIKSISAGGNNDGIDVFSSSNVTVDGVFLRNSDDNIAIYGHRWNYYGDTRNVTVQNSILWADVAHPILVGTHGNTDHPETLEDLTFLNLDILDQREPQLDYQGCLSLNAGDSNLIRNVRFDNIRVENFREGQLLNLRVFFNTKYNTSPGRGIEDVLFKDIRYDGTRANPSVIAGYDETRGVKNVIFENLRINGRLISDDMPGKPRYFKTGDMARIIIGEHVQGVVFRAAPAKNSGGIPPH